MSDGTAQPPQSLTSNSGEFRGLARRIDDQTLTALRMAFDAAREGILLCDARDRVIFFNRSYAEIVGTPITRGMAFEDVLRKRLADGDIVDALGREDAWLQDRLASRRAFGEGFELHVCNRWFQVTDQPAPDGGSLTLVVDVSARKRAEKALRSSEAVISESASLFRAIFEQAAVGIAKSALDGRLLEVNQKFCQMLGYRREELLERSLTNLVEERDQTVTLASPGTAARVDESTFVSEKLFIRKDGSRLWCNLSRNVTWTPSGSPDYVVSVIEDISARKMAEQSAVAANMRLQNGLEHLGEMVVLTDAEDRIVFANRRFLEFNAPVAEYAKPGCSYADHLKAGVALGLFPDAIGQEDTWLAQRVALRRHPRGPVERLRQDGRWLLVDDQRLPDGGTISFGIEITDRKRAEAELRASELRFKSLVALSSDLFWETDANHRFVSQHFGEVSRLRAHVNLEIGKTRWEIPSTSPDEKGWARHRAQLDAHEVFLDFEVGRPTTDGAQRFASVSGEPVFDAHGAFVGYRGVSKDITARKLAELGLRSINVDLEQRIAERTAAMETAYRELESFSYSVSHDLRAPLRSISGYAGLLREDDGDRLSDEGRVYLATIDESARHMGRLIDALLALASTSRQALHRAPVNMTELARVVVKELKGDYPAALVIVADLPNIVGDATLLRQTLTNLVGNALKYSAKSNPQQVDIGVASAGTETVFFVRDNGVGFDMAYADKLFQAFGRLHTGVEFQGTGIGLVLTKLIVERHGGRIWAESQPGAGARFNFTLGSPQIAAPG